MFSPLSVAINGISRLQSFVCVVGQRPELSIDAAPVPSEQKIPRKLGRTQRCRVFKQFGRHWDQEGKTSCTRICDTPPTNT